MTNPAILWRRLDRPGHESSRVFFQDSRWHLTGAAVFAHEGQPCRLDYFIVCNAQWETLFGRVSGWLGADTIEIEVSVDSARRWRLNGSDIPNVEGCIDLDLNFSPSTNLLPIRRLGLQVGQSAPVRAAWLRFPSFTLELLEQVYRRLDTHLYRYESTRGSFVAELQVNDDGFATLYPGLCQAE